MKNKVSAPVAKKSEKIIENFNDKRVDFYDWLRDKDYPISKDRFASCS